MPFAWNLSLLSLVFSFVWINKMDHRDIRILKILEEIEKDYVPSQRDLARKLNVSVGLVNSFIKRLAHKGYFKIITISKNRVKYILTPKGMAEKTRLTYEYVQHSFQFYKSARHKLRKLFNDLVAEGVRCVVFYGAGELAEIAYISLKDIPIEIVAVVDDRKMDEKFLGIIVTASAKLASLSFDKIIITTIRSKNEALDKILENGIARKKVVMLQ